MAGSPAITSSRSDSGSESSSEGPAVAPADLLGEFPSPVLATFNSIDTAPYKFVQPKRFAKRFGAFNRKQIIKNFDLSQRLAMSELDAELQGLTKYAPAAAALKRQQTAEDNLFNQTQRTKQFDETLPGMRAALQAQAKQAAQLAKGEIPDFLSDAENQALELGLRSASADQSTMGGFGAGSSVARKASDLMSADARYKMNVQKYQMGLQQTQYGNELLSQNAALQANMLLAPTEYSNAGSEIRTMPEIGGARLTAGALSEINAQTLIPTELAFRSKIQQQQYRTTNEQQTRMFNATGQFNASTFNASAQNQFALDKFGYQVGYAGAVAGTDTANNNTALGLQQQAQAQQVFQDYAQQAQAAGQSGAISAGASTVIGAASNAIQGIAGLFSPNNQPSTDSGGISTPTIDAGSIGDFDFGGGGPTVGGQTIEAPTASGGYGDTSSYDGSGGVSYDQSEYGGGGGSTIGPDLSVPDFSYRTASIRGNNFQAATGVPFQASYQGGSDASLRMAGITKDASAIPGAVGMGTDYQGHPVYSNPALLSNQDSTAGMQMGSTLGYILAPLGALDQEGLDKVNGISQLASDQELISTLDGAAAKGNSGTFIGALLDAFGKGPLANLDKHGAATAYAAYEGMQNWSQMSPAQKSILTASFGLKATDFGGGKNLGEVTIPSTEKPGTVPVTIAKATEWFSKGINAYPLTRKWDKYSTIAKVVGGVSNPDAVANIASQFKLLGAGISGAEVPGVTAQSLKASGWTPTAHLGVGAIVADKSATLPQGYTRVATVGNQQVASPPGTAYTAQGAITRSASRVAQLSPIGNTLNNIAVVGTGAANIINAWQGRRPVAAVVSGANAVAKIIDSANRQEAQLSGDASKASNYSQVAGAATQAYAAYQAAKQGNYIEAAGFGSAAAFNGMAAWAKKQGNAALAAQYSQYAGYAQAGLNFYDAYNQYKAGNKIGAGLTAAGGAAELAGFGGAGLVGAGAATSYNAWGTGNVAQGAIGGSMMMAGTAMMVGGPVGWAVGGGLLAVSVLGSSFGNSTTNKEHAARDGFRDYLKSDSGLVDEDMNLTLADGTKYSIGQEDDSGRHSVTDPSRLTEDQKDKGSGDSLRAYDCDYTNDLDFTSTMMGQTLGRLIAGGSDTNVDQIGTAIGNAGIANIGYNQQMSRENFEKMAANQRSFMAKAGIGSKNDAYQVANQAYADGRIDELEHTQAIQSINMMFDDNGYATAQQLMSGRDKGAAVASENAAAQEKVPAATNPGGRPIGPVSVPSETTIGMGSLWEGKTPQQVDPGFIVSGYTGTSVPPEMIPYLKKNNTTRMSKADIRALNASRYQSEAS